MLCLVIQLCLNLCDPMDCSLPGSSVHGLSRQEYWSGLPCPPPGDLLNPGIEHVVPALQANSLLLSDRGGPQNPTPETYCKSSPYTWSQMDCLRAESET